MRRRAVWWACALLVALATAPAQAYLKFGVEVGGRTVPVRWAPGPIRYFIFERDFGGVSAQAFSDAIGRATTTWNAVPGLPVTFSPQGLTRSQPLEADGRSTLGFLDRPDQERVLGATTFLLDATTGALIESDVYFNTRFRWSTAAAGEPGATDLESGELVGGYTLNANGDFVIAGVREGPHILRVEPLDDADVESFFGPANVDIAFSVTYGPRLAVVQAGGATSPLVIEVRPK